MFDYKNASKKELKEQFNKIAKEQGDDQFFTKKELNHLPEVLMDNEQVLAFSSGIMDGNTWLITLTDQRIIFLDKGMIFGLKQTVINLDSIKSVSGETGIFFGKIIITEGTTNYKIDNVWKKTVKNFTNKVQEQMQKINKTANNSQQIIKEESIEDKIEKLHNLKEKGLISDEEFESAKYKALGI